MVMDRYNGDPNYDALGRPRTSALRRLVTSVCDNMPSIVSGAINQRTVKYDEWVPVFSTNMFKASIWTHGPVNGEGGWYVPPITTLGIGGAVKLSDTVDHFWLKGSIYRGKDAMQLYGTSPYVYDLYFETSHQGEYIDVKCLWGDCPLLKGFEDSFAHSIQNCFTVYNPPNRFGAF